MMDIDDESPFIAELGVARLRWQEESSVNRLALGSDM